MIGLAKDAEQMEKLYEMLSDIAEDGKCDDLYEIYAPTIDFENCVIGFHFEIDEDVVACNDLDGSDLSLLGNYLRAQLINFRTSIVSGAKNAMGARAEHLKEIAIEDCLEKIASLKDDIRKLRGVCD